MRWRSARWRIPRWVAGTATLAGFTFLLIGGAPSFLHSSHAAGPGTPASTVDARLLFDTEATECPLCQGLARARTAVSSPMARPEPAAFLIRMALRGDAFAHAAPVLDGTRARAPPASA